MRITRPRKILLWCLGLFVAVALLLHLVLPPIILGRLNAYLADFSPVYSIQIKGLDLSFVRMAYRFEKLEAKYKKDGHTFFTLDTLDVSVAWRELLTGRVLTDIVADGGEFFLTRQLVAGSGKEAQPKEKAREAADALFPLRIARIEVTNSSFEFGDFVAQKTETRWRVSNIDGKILNFNPRPNQPLTFFTVQGALFDNSKFKVAGTAKRLDEPMAWKADYELREFNLVSANPMLLRQVPFTFTSGHLDLYGEAKSEGGVLRGYVKPFLRSVAVLKTDEHFVNAKHFFVEIIGALGNVILRRSDNKSVATRVAFSNEGGKFRTDNGQAIESLIEHGFGEPLVPGIENSLTLEERKSP